MMLRIGRMIGRGSGSLSRAATLLAGRTDGVAGSFVDSSLMIIDSVTPANSFTGVPSDKLTYSSASAKYIRLSTGLFASASTLRNEYTAAGVAMGVRFEQGSTNRVLWNRDLTNAAWTKTSCSAAKDQTGIDGVSNSASSLTASGANATCLQAITSGSAARIASTFIKRITGSGTIDMTMDNGGTWTTVTVTSSWTQVSVPSATLTNPTVGFRIVTSGDAIAVDMAQEESGAVVTSPIATTTASVTRNIDVVTMASSLFNLSSATGTLYLRGSISTTSGTKHCIGLDDGTANERLRLDVATAQPSFFGTDGGATVINAGTGVTLTVDTSFKHAGGYTLNNSRSAANGTAGALDSVCTMPTVTTLRLASGVGGTIGMNGHLEEFMYLPTRLTDAELQTLSTL